MLDLYRLGDACTAVATLRVGGIGVPRVLAARHPLEVAQMVVTRVAVDVVDFVTLR